jgi:hypothetical protein
MTAEIKRLAGHPNFPLLLLLTINLLAGLWTFRDYGFSWDEPLFYSYADSVGYAYSIKARLSKDFDIRQAYGASPDDHKTRGPAYILLADPAAKLLYKAGLDQASAWHLLNFLTVQIGLVFFYLLARRFADPWPAGAATALYAWQPLFWGHAFINPKDPSFTVFMLASIYLGLRMVDRITAGNRLDPWQIVRASLLPGILLGLTTSIRIIGPLAGGLVLLYFLLKGKYRHWWIFLPYGLITILAMLACWPYLWSAPVANFLSVFRFMADNPTELAVLFLGQTFRADHLPHRYFPTMLVLTLTEVVWPLFAIGLVVAARRLKRLDWRALLIVLVWFWIPFVYVLVKSPPMYDGFRHFFFSAPPIFLVGGLAFQAIFDSFHPIWLRAVLVILVLLPGVVGIVRLHPFEYTYYNSLAGGTGGAFRQYETDYWLTCYKEAMAWVDRNAPDGTVLYVPREPYIAAYYAKPAVHVSQDAPAIGDWMLFSTRSNLDQRSIYRKQPVLHAVSREGADFCLVKQFTTQP